MGFPNIVAIAFAFRKMQSFASWYPGLVDKSGACLSSSTPRR